MATTSTTFRIGLDDKTKAKLNRISKNFKKMGRDVQKVGANFSKSLTLPILGVVGGLAALGKQAIVSAEKVQKLSMRLGVSTDAMSKYQFVAQQAGVENKTMVKSWQTMVKNVGDAAEGFGLARDSLVDLNVSASELNKLTPEKQFEVLADALESVQNPAEKLRIAMQIFGGRGAEMIQMMNGGSEAMKKQAAFAAKLGIVIDQDLANSSAKIIDKFGILKNQIQGVGISIAKFALPYVNTFADKLSLLIERVKNLSSGQVKFIATIAGIAAAIGPVLMIFAKMILTFPAIHSGFTNMVKTLKGLKFAFAAVSGTAMLWVAGIALALGAIMVIWANWGDNIKSFLSNMWGGITKGWAKFTDWLSTTTEKGLQVVSKAWKWLSDGIVSVMKPVLTWIGDAYSTVINGVMSLMGTFVSYLGSMSTKLGNALNIDKLKEAGEKLEGFGDTLKNTKVDIPEFAGAILEKLKSGVDGGSDYLTGIDWGEKWSGIQEGFASQSELVKQQFTDMLNGMGLGELLIGMGLENTDESLTNEGTSLTNEDGFENEEDPTQKGMQKVESWKSFMVDQFKDITDLSKNSAAAMAKSFANAATLISDVMGDAFGDLMTNMVGLTDGPIMIGRAFGDMAVGIIKNLAGIIIKMIIMKALASALGFSIGPMPSMSQIVGGSLTGKKAEGGHTGMGNSFLVGEKGPEIFTPTNSGNITPNNEIGQSVNVTNNITINAEGNLLNDPLSLRRVTEAINEEMDKVQRTYLQPA